MPAHGGGRPSQHQPSGYALEYRPVADKGDCRRILLGMVLLSPNYSASRWNNVT